jgi:hypothetical protein
MQIAHTHGYQPDGVRIDKVTVLPQQRRVIRPEKFDDVEQAPPR